MIHDDPMKGKLPSVFVAITTLNSGSLLEKCLSGVFSQDYKGEMKVMILDSGSTDNTLDIARKFPCEIQKLDGNYNTGLNGARDISVQLCNSDLYWQIDTDNIIEERDTLRKLVEPFILSNEVYISVPMIKFSEEYSKIDKWFWKYEYEKLREMVRKGIRRDNCSHVKDMDYGITNASLIKMSLLRSVGGYDGDVRVLDRARSRALSNGVVVLNAYYYHVQGQTYLRWFKKWKKRIKFFGSMTDEQIKNYFHPESLNHKYRKTQMSLVGEYFKISMSLLKQRENYWYYGIFILIGFFLIFIYEPIPFINTFRKFL